MGLHHEPAAGVDGGSDDLVSDDDLDRHGLAGEHGRVDGGAALDDGPVGGDLLPGADHEAVTDGELPDGDAFLDLAAVRAFPQHGDVLGAELEQGTQGRAGAALGAGLEVAPGQDERGHPGGDLEVDVAGPVRWADCELEGVGHAGDAGGAQQQCVERPGERGEGAK